MKTAVLGAVSLGVSYVGYRMDFFGIQSRLSRYLSNDSGLDSLKNTVKKMEAGIRKSKKELYARSRQGLPCGHIHSRIEKLSHLYRHHYTAYCELKGLNRSQIESSSTRRNVDENFILQIKRRHS